jgi:hypothetical protein
VIYFFLYKSYNTKKSIVYFCKLSSWENKVDLSIFLETEDAVFIDSLGKMTWETRRAMIYEKNTLVRQVLDCFSFRENSCWYVSHLHLISFLKDDRKHIHEEDDASS